RTCDSPADGRARHVTAAHRVVRRPHARPARRIGACARRSRSAPECGSSTPSDPVTGPRPGTLVLVVGTGTEIGKTWLSARLLERWRAGGLSVAARKPAQSFDPGDPEAQRTDAQILAAASGEAPFTVCPER